jgi:hypothetical protein
LYQATPPQWPKVPREDFDRVLELSDGADSPVAMTGMKIALLKTTELIRGNRWVLSSAVFAASSLLAHLHRTIMADDYFEAKIGLVG